ncbi:MAG: hypothetical protein NUW37_14605 [Planctomycetes bacterium]|nr:hypothetical protein [Planctomycetota bacterium]
MLAALPSFGRAVPRQDPESDDFNLTGDWIFNMTLLSGSSTYGKWPEYAQQGTTSLIPVIHHEDGTLEFESPDPSITLSGTMEGDQVTVNFHQVLSNEETHNVFEGNATFTSTITKKPSDDGSSIIATIDGTYSGSGWLQFYDEQALLTDFGSWQGQFKTYIYSSIDRAPSLILAHDLSVLLDSAGDVVGASAEEMSSQVDSLLSEFEDGEPSSSIKVLVIAARNQIMRTRDVAMSRLREIFNEAQSNYSSVKKINDKSVALAWKNFLNNFKNYRHYVDNEHASAIRSIAGIGNRRNASLCSLYRSQFELDCMRKHTLESEIAQENDYTRVIHDRRK